MARTKNIDTSADVRTAPAAEYAGEKTTTGWQTHKRETKYERFNIYIKDKTVYADFQVYCKSVGLTPSKIFNDYVERVVAEHREEIAEARVRFEAAHKHFLND